MPTRDTAETRAVTLVDLPLVRRLSESGTILDSELCYTQEASGTQSYGLTTLLLPYRGVHTMVTRAEKQQVAGQFRLRENDVYAHLAYVAPLLEEGDDDTAYLHLLDAMAGEAGKRGAHLLAAEVDENAALFKTMRTASYAIYARQEIWYRTPAMRVDYHPRHPVELHQAREDDLNGIYILYGNIVPKLVQPVTELPGEDDGFVYRKDDRVEGFIGVAEGSRGIYLTPHLHPDAFSEATDVIAAAIQKVEHSTKLPVYVRVRRYQDWLDDALVELGFEICARQAVMVKHIAAGVRAASFAPLHHKLEAVPSPAKPPGGITDYSQH
ncbi:MAG: hypothetical protein J0L63_08585 [Anaerolineae bacterium]|nr:hypothetical protein [Anaerolineae bacterium]MBN8618949.1 hypothetical protein [Anaerolineae bacterium]